MVPAAVVAVAAEGRAAVVVVAAEAAAANGATRRNTYQGQCGVARSSCATAGYAAEKTRAGRRIATAALTRLAVHLRERGDRHCVRPLLSLSPHRAVRGARPTLTLGASGPSERPGAVPSALNASCCPRLTILRTPYGRFADYHPQAFLANSPAAVLCWENQGEAESWRSSSDRPNQREGWDMET